MSRCRRSNPLKTSWNGSNKLCSKWSPTTWTSFCRSSREASFWVHRSSNLLPKIRQQWWTTCSNEQTSTLCLKMTFARLLNKSWSPIVRPETTMQEAQSPQANWGRLIRGKTTNNSQVKLAWPPSVSHTKSSSQWSMICLISGGRSRSRQIRLNKMCLSQRSWPYHRVVQKFPLPSGKTNQGWAPTTICSRG